MKTYETNRNLITGIENKAGTNLISQFSYLNDAIDRRTRRIDNSPALNGSATNNFDYNVRGASGSALNNRHLGVYITN